MFGNKLMSANSPIPLSARLDAAATGIAGNVGAQWLIARTLFGPPQDNEDDVRNLMIFSFSGLAFSLFAIQNFPSLVATLAGCP